MRKAALLLLLIPLALGACGKQRQPSPALLTLTPPGPPAKHVIKRAGMTVKTPSNWRYTKGVLPRTFITSSGSALITGWAYLREEPLPKGTRELTQARKRLVRSIEARKPKLSGVRSRPLRVAGHDAIEVRGTQSLRGQAFTTRSVHVFTDKSEYVIDELSPPADFQLVNRQAMKPLLRSLKLTGTRKAKPPPTTAPTTKAPTTTAPTTSTPATTPAPAPKAPVPTAPTPTPPQSTVPLGTTPAAPAPKGR